MTTLDSLAVATIYRDDMVHYFDDQIVHEVGWGDPHTSSH